MTPLDSKSVSTATISGYPSSRKECLAAAIELAGIPTSPLLEPVYRQYMDGRGASPEITMRFIWAGSTTSAPVWSTMVRVAERAAPLSAPAAAGLASFLVQPTNPASTKVSSKQPTVVKKTFFLIKHLLQSMYFPAAVQMPAAAEEGKVPYAPPAASRTGFQMDWISSAVKSRL